jgi:hypothetical protein
MRFLGGKWQIKINGYGKGNGMSVFAGVMFSPLAGGSTALHLAGAVPVGKMDFVGGL